MKKIGKKVEKAPVAVKKKSPTKTTEKVSSKSKKESTAKTLAQKFQEEMNNRFGVNAIMLGRDIIPFAQTKILTGSVSLDIALGGGIPIGRFIHISGMESCGKSTLTYHIIKNAQKMKKVVIEVRKDVEVKKSVPMKVLLIQSEHGTFTSDYGEKIGINVDELMINQCQGMEEGLEIALQAQKLEMADLICFDSFEGLTPTKEYDSSMMDSVQMGIKPKLFGEYFRKYCAINNKLLREGKQPCTIVGINQLREKIGAYGDPLYAGGGNAIKFYASIEVRFRKGDNITIGTGNNKVQIGQEIKFKVNKNKVEAPMRTGSYDLYTDEGGAVPKGFIDVYKEIVLESIMYEVIDKSGSWLSYGDIKVQGSEALINIVKEDERLFEELRVKLMEIVKEDDDLSVDMCAEDDVEIEVD